MTAAAMSKALATDLAGQLKDPKSDIMNGSVTRPRGHAGGGIEGALDPLGGLA